MVQPGQFAHLRIPPLTNALLRRPFSIYQVAGDTLSILYKAVGKGTETLSRMRPGEELDADAVAELVADNARYDVFELSAAAMTGNAARALRILGGLKGEGVAPPFIIWALVNDLRGVSQVMHEVAQRRSFDDACRNANVWSNRKVNVQAGMRRLNPRSVESLLLSAARADRVAKGAEYGDEWVEIERLVARIAGVPLAA